MSNHITMESHGPTKFGSRGRDPAGWGTVSIGSLAYFSGDYPFISKVILNLVKQFTFMINPFSNFWSYLKCFLKDQVHMLFLGSFQILGMLEWVAVYATTFEVYALALQSTQSVRTCSWSLQNAFQATEYRSSVSLWSRVHINFSWSFSYESFHQFLGWSIDRADTCHIWNTGFGSECQWVFCGEAFGTPQVAPSGRGTVSTWNWYKHHAKEMYLIINSGFHNPFGSLRITIHVENIPSTPCPIHMLETSKYASAEEPSNDHRVDIDPRSMLNLRLVVHDVQRSVQVAWLFWYFKEISFDLCVPLVILKEPLSFHIP